MPVPAVHTNANAGDEIHPSLGMNTLVASLYKAEEKLTL